jgi:hypothetical protein
MRSVYRSFPALFLILLGACSPGAGPAGGIPTVTLDLTSAPILLTVDSTSDQIQQVMLSSATKWQSLWMDGTVIVYAPDGTFVGSSREQVWIDQAASRFRILSGAVDGSPEMLKACDGAAIIEMNPATGSSQGIPLPDFARVSGYVPPLEEGAAHPNPLWGQIGTPLSQLAFSSDFAQNQGTFRSVVIEPVAGREALVVEWTFTANSQPSWKLWLDTQTGVILKMQEYGKDGSQILQGERVVNQVTINSAFDDALFRPPASMPGFGDAYSAAGTAEATAFTPASGKDALGELYFFTLPHQAGQSIQMVRLPGKCVVGESACPQLETVSVPFPFLFNLSALSWSPDGRLAAFAYSDNPNGTPTKLFVFDPAAGTWISLAEFPYIDPPFWSPDGTWIAFREQDGQGGEDVYAVHRDGTELKNLTASGNLPPAGRPYVMDGWFTENIIVRSALPGTGGNVYLVRVGDGYVRPMFETLLTKATFIPSPDNAWFAYDEYDYNSQQHVVKVVEPDGANPVEVVSFAGGNVYPIVWSPDARRLGFVHSSTDANFNPVADAYVIGSDGRGLTQVYKGTTVGRILFSPDGRTLLVEETTSPTGGHLFVINLETLKPQILQAPSLSLDSDWYAPSWRP